LFVTRLIEAIAVIAPGPRFERFGGVFLRHCLGVPLNNRGLNVLGSPVGHTIDTVSDLGDIAAEYTIEKRYFDGRMVKPWGDPSISRGVNHDDRIADRTAPRTGPEITQTPRGTFRHVSTASRSELV
jgi:hypothetical protein